MPVWKTQPLIEEPEVSLISWSIFEVGSPLWEGLSRHFVGYHFSSREGRVSSPIAYFDGETNTGYTVSGRKYKMIGEPGTSGDGMYVFNQWMRLNECSYVVDVTKEYETK